MYAVYLQQVVGKVVEIFPVSKAIISFHHENREHRALLWVDRLIVPGKPIVTDDIRQYLQVGSKIAFKCHTFDPNGKDACGWFVVAGIRQEKRDREINDMFRFGIVSGQGMFSSLSPRQGVLHYADENGESFRVLCQASKIRLYGKRLNSKQKLDKVMQLDLCYQFDAVPTNELENDSQCSWFATSVWNKNRPEDVKKRVNLEQEDLSVPMLSEIKAISTVARGVFWQGYGQVWSVIDDDYVVVLGRVKPNYYETILAHRSCLTLSGVRAGTVPLSMLFIPGDKLQFVAVPAREEFNVQWVATHISPDTTGTLREDINTLT